MKKLLVLLITLSMILAIVPFGGIAAEDIDDFFDTLGGGTDGEISVEVDPDADLSYLEILYTLDIISQEDMENETVFKTVTRGKTVRLMLKMLGYSDEAVSGNSIKGIFLDVDENTPYASEIEFAASIGMIKGYGDGTFKPESPVSYNEALKMIICALGYGPEAEEKGGYYTGYYLTAHVLKLTKFAAQEEVNTFRIVSRIIYNALNVKSLTGVYGKNDIEYKKDKTTILEDVFETKMYTGIVEAVGKTSIYGYVDQPDNRIVINGVAFNSDVSSPKDYIGRRVRFFVKNMPDANYDTVIGMEIMDVNNVVTLDINDVENSDTQKIYFYDENDKKSNLKVAGSNIVYNGRGISYDPNMIKPTHSETGIPMDGYITWIDNDGDNVGDVLIVDSYWSFFTDTVIPKQGKVADYYYSLYRPTDKYNSFYTADNMGNNEQYIYKNGKAVNFSDIKKKNVLSVQKSFNGISNVYTLTITDKKITGTVSVVDSEGYITINNEEYELSEYYKYMQANAAGNAPVFEVGDKTTVYLDMFGKIVGCESVTKKSMGNYYYVLDYGLKGSALEIRTIDTMGKVESREISSEVKYKGRNASSATQKSPKAIGQEWEGAGYVNAPVKMKLDEEGNVTYLEVVNLINLARVASKSGNIIATDETETFTGGMFKSGDELKFGSKTVMFGIGYGAPGQPWNTDPNLRAENYNLRVNEDYTYLMTNKLTSTYTYANTVLLSSFVDMVYVADYDPATQEIGLIVVDTLPNDEYHDGVFTNAVRTAEEMARKYPDLDMLGQSTNYPQSGFEQRHAKYFGEWNRFDPRDSRNNNLLLVNKVLETYNDDGDLIKTIIGLQGGKEVTVDVRADAVFWSDTNAAAGSNWFEPVDIYNKDNNENLANRYYKDFGGAQPDILPGDVYATVHKIDGSIQELYFIANMDEGPTVYGTDENAVGKARHLRSFAGNMKWGYCFAAVHGIDDSTVFVRDRGDGTSNGSSIYSTENGVQLEEFTINSNALYMWNFETKKFVKADKDNDLIPSYMRYAELPENTVTAGSAVGNNAENNVWMLIGSKHWRAEEMIFADYYDSGRYYED